MGKKWRYKDPDLDCREKYYDSNDVSYNAVEYKYPSKPLRSSFRQWDTTNADKFKEMFKKNKLLNQDKNSRLGQTDTSITCQPQSTMNGDELGDNIEIESSKVKKKKKSKKDKIDKLALSNIDESVIDVNSKKRMKKHSTVNSEVEENLSVVLNDNGTQTSKLERKNKSKKKGNVDTPSIEVADGEDTFNLLKQKKAKKKVRLETSQDEEIISKKECKRIKKLKKESSENVMYVTHISEKKKKKKSKTKEISGETEGNDMDDNFKEPEINNSLTMVEIAGSSENKKKKKKSKLLETSIDVSESEQNMKVEIENSVSCRKMKKKKKKSKKVDTFVEVENIISENVPSFEIIVKLKSKKKKRKKINEEMSDDDQVSCGKNTTNKKRKHEESFNHVDDSIGESTPKKKKKKSVVENAVMGQWASASFETDSKKDKFMRLMGGVKVGKELSNKGQKPGFEISRFNSALNRENEAKLKEGLEKQFNTAISIITNKGKGSGLGFEKDPAEGKKFHIDSTRRKSVKFDD